MTSFDFKTWCSDYGLKQKTIDELGKSDQCSQEALKLVHIDDIAKLDLGPQTKETPASRLSRTE